MIACWLFIASTCVLVFMVAFLVGGGIVVAHKALTTEDPLDLEGQERVGL